MKRIVLFALVTFGLSFGQVKAQSFSMARDTTVIFTGASGDVHNTLTNLTTDPLPITWRMTNSSIASGWVVSGVCDINLCYNWAGDVEMGGTKNCTVNPSSNMDFKVQYNATGGAIGSSSFITFRFVDGNTGLLKTATFIATKVPTGVVNVSKVDDDVVLYPNPAKDDLNVIFDPNSDVKNIAVYNLIGKIVSIYKVNGNSAKINVSNVPSGIYFVRLLDGQGRVVATRKFTRQ
ncbi:MAG TPA: T9SS type A sorting domain-containing protein [Flavipsychrobacter sp.]|nr:T9SS type A sorting domain-containing protein [Flavipsychrobacter sp.]